MLSYQCTKWKVITKLKNKLVGNELTVLKADKGKTTVILIVETTYKKT
jgi:hypothetical protein